MTCRWCGTETSDPSGLHPKCAQKLDRIGAEMRERDAKREVQRLERGQNLSDRDVDFLNEAAMGDESRRYQRPRRGRRR